MLTKEFKEDLKKIDDIVNQVTDIFNERELSPFVAICVCDHLTRMAQGGLDQWMDVYRGIKDETEKKELKESTDKGE